jgi:hypothetical protein
LALRFLISPIIADQVTARRRRARIILFLVWIALVLWMVSNHAFWRDEVRAFSLAQSGSNFSEFFRAIHGEGHPAIWYLLLRGAYEVVPDHAVLPVVAATVGIATGAMVAFRSPFRLGIIFLILFSNFALFEYSVVARNYGISALVMLILAALYPQVRGNLWLGILAAILANTNVPAAILASCYLLLRLVELLSERSGADRRTWLIFAANCAVAALGAYLCFRTIYPTFNDGAVSPNMGSINPISMLWAVFYSQEGFVRILGPPAIQQIMLFLVLLGFVNRPAPLLAAIAGYLMLKLFFHFIYPSAYRHESLYLVFLLSLHWIGARGRGKREDDQTYTAVYAVGAWAFVQILAVQTYTLTRPLAAAWVGMPYSRAAEAAKLLEEHKLTDAIIMADPDPIAETLAYYSSNPLWFLREQKFGKVVRLTNRGRTNLTLDDVLSDAERLHRQTGRPIVFLSLLKLEPVHKIRHMMYENTTTLTPESVLRLKRTMRMIADLRPAYTDEEYEIYVYPAECCDGPESRTARFQTGPRP